MDAINKDKKIDTRLLRDIGPSREQAEDAVRTLIEWAGDNPDREGLLDTPARVVRAFEEYFSGYQQDASHVLSKTFEEVENYNEMVIVKNIEVTSHCEHHMVPVIGKAHIGYLPDGQVVGLSKLARVVDVFARRLQTQETMTMQIANAIEQALKPKGLAIIVEAAHHCMTMRGVQNRDTLTTTTQFRGLLHDNPVLAERFLRLVGKNSSDEA